MAVILFVVFGVIALIVVIASLVMAGKRRDTMRAFAADCSLTYYRHDPFNIEDRFAFFSLFNKGHSKKATNVLSGVYRGHEYVACDYRYVTGSGKNRSTHNQSVCICKLDHSFPGLQLRPENFLDKAAGFFGFDDIDFESDEFSRKFFVKSENKKFAYDVCHPRMMEWLLVNRGWHLEMTNRCMMVQDGRTWQAKKFRSAFNYVESFLERIPEFVIKEYE